MDSIARPTRQSGMTNQDIRTISSLLFTLLLLATSGVLMSSCGESNGDERGPSGDSVGELAPGIDPDAKPEMVVDSGGPVITHRATIVTDKGMIIVGLYGLDAPKTVANFAGLAEKDFYDSLLFHRVVPGFVVQTGDPGTRDTSAASKATWGQGGESIYGGEFEDELNSDSPSGMIGYKSGVLAMANRGPNTNTSQFFIVLSDDIYLPYGYTIFGRVTEGMEAVKEIEKSGYVFRENRETGKIDTLQVDIPQKPVMIYDIAVEELLPDAGNGTDIE